MGVLVLTCATCGTPFEKAKKEYDRRIRDRATRFFCGLSCTVVGGAISLPHSTIGWSAKTDRHKRASLDRIDSSKGYVQGNVRFVAVMANLAKADFHDRELVDFCEAVARVSSAGRTKTC